MLNKKFLISALFLLSSSSMLLNANDGNEQNLKKIKYSLSFQFANVSKTDVNRIVCENGEVGKLIYSKDKEISMQKDGSNAFVKLLPVTTRANGTIIDSRVNDFNRDVYIECNNKMFSLNLVPTDITAQTILLTSDGLSVNNENAGRYEKSNSFEKTVIDIIKNVYKDKEPDGYGVKQIKQASIKFKEIELFPRKVYAGNDYKVYEYKIVALEDVELDEKMFINFIANNPLALSLTDLNLKKGKEARLFVISNALVDPLTLDEKKVSTLIIENNKEKSDVKADIKEEVMKWKKNLKPQKRNNY